MKTERLTLYLLSASNNPRKHVFVRGNAKDKAVNGHHQKKLFYLAMCLCVDVRLLTELSGGFLCASLFSLAGQL